MHSRVKIESRFRLARTLLLFVWAAASAAVVFYSVHRATGGAEEAIRRDARETLAVQSETLNGVLDKYRLMPPLLARQSSVASLFILDAEDNPQRVAARRMAHRLMGMSGALDVAFFFPDGRLLAHANGPFVAARSGLDTLIRDASRGQLGRAMLSLGPQTRSYAFAAGVRRNGRLVGIVVVYVDFLRVEIAWALSNRPIFVTDPDGMVVLANVAGWRMRPQGEIGTADGERFVLGEGGGRQRFIDLTRRMPVLDWDLHVLADPAPVRQARISAGAIGTLACLLAGLIMLILMRRYEGTLIRQRADRANSLRLERIVRDRTRALSESNLTLSREVEVRREAEEKLRAAQAELVQSARLAALGQMSAAISHEFNQPLAAIRSYADNGLRFLEMGRSDRTSENLGRINSMVERMAELSRTLLAFARKPGQSVGPVQLGTVVEEALLLARPRAGKAGVEIALSGPLAELVVLAGRIRLGQVFVNLVNNAVHALAGHAQGHIRISARRRGRKVVIEVADNGPGIPEDKLDRVFDPFFTTKAMGEGIGIGLSIVDNIVRDFGGRISVRNRAEGGACFTIELNAATGTEKAAAMVAEAETA